MSRIGKRPIILNSKVNIKINNRTIFAEGPKGSLKYNLPCQVKAQKEKNQLILYAEKKDKKTQALHGLSRTIVNNMIVGVSKGFCKKLQIQGVGYRAQVDSSQNLILNLGYSHPIYMIIPSNISIEVNNSTEINIYGINKEDVGQFAAQVRSKRPPEPYKGKGIRYSEEAIKKKVGKAGK